MMAGTEAGMVVEAMDTTTMEEAMATTMGTAGAMDMTMVMEKAEVRGQGPAALSRAPTVSATIARYEIGDSMDMGNGHGYGYAASKRVLILRTWGVQKMALGVPRSKF